VRGYDSRRWGDRRVIDRMLQAYAVKDTTIIFLIQQDSIFKKTTLNNILGKIINHDMLVEEVNHVKNLSKDITSSRKQDITFKASKKVIEEISSEEEDDDDSDDERTKYDLDDMAFFIRRFSKMKNKQTFFKGDKKNKYRKRTKRACYNCGKYGHYIANCPHERREEEDDEKKVYKKDKHYKKKIYGEAHTSNE
jgi:hypothetical protein